ncbi:MAG: heme NO-binding domain-containing protein, partial [Planctomycetes bacterium]|nr:heme NO-binding domain-containing protein [Planctomycetota bacterium]
MNKAIEEMVIHLKGPAAWESLKRSAGVDVDTFVGMDQYDDTVTYKLVDAASVRMKMSAEDILEAFGEYWILYTAHKGYGELMSAAGNGVFETLANLDDMHARVELLYPDMRIPVFTFRRSSDTEGVLHYSSQRAGLAPMVVGLVKGLGKRCGTPVCVDRLAR